MSQQVSLSLSDYHYHWAHGGHGTGKSLGETTCGGFHSHGAMGVPQELDGLQWVPRGPTQMDELEVPPNFQEVSIWGIYEGYILHNKPMICIMPIYDSIHPGTLQW